ncbi:HD domain-containing phosphohydrolase [Thioalkalivibrio sp. ALR17-21]|uniref:HD domain-containing phosphohydrolase n=1 Tax=Thioalkalivibrio sp. ALR17-21 TaxID=1269813 RepID=UPI000407058A|nr:HD domain-containing phosphohydrolase [Thioalkalivibrio sp. ALR17-21]
MRNSYLEKTVDFTRLLFECPRIEQAHQQWLQALDAIPDPILLHDNDGRILRVNQAYAEKAGASYGELIGSPYWHFFPRQDDPLPECRAIAEGADYRSRELHLASGEAYQLFAYAVRDPEADQRFAFNVFRDITDEVRHRQQRQEQEAFFTTLAETARDAVVVMDPEGQVAYWNRAAEEVFGYSSGEVLGKPLHPLIAAPRHQGKYEAGLRHFVETGEGAVVGDTLELEAQHKDGTVFLVELSVSAVQFEGGWHALGILRDITRRKTRERRLARTTEYLRALIQAHSALVTAEDEGQLFQDVCQALADAREYPLVWVGMAREGADHPVEVVGSAGPRTDYLDTVVVTWDSSESTGQGPTGRAIREGKPQMTRNMATDPSFTPWREPARERGFASSIALPLQVDGETIGALNVYATEPEAFDDEEQSLLEGLAKDLSRGLKALRTQKERDESQTALQEALVDTVEAIARLVDKRDPYTAGHQKRVAELSQAIGRKLGWSEDRVKGLYLAGLIHDLGKISIPSEILSRPGTLSPMEFELIKEHARAGYDIIRDVAFPWPVADAVLQHHERLDGSGYPDGLSGDEILLEGQILAVADVVEAVCSHRPYRPAFGIEAALDVIQNGRGTQFSPEIVDTCLALFRDDGFLWEDTEARSAP